LSNANTDTHITGTHMIGMWLGRGLLSVDDAWFEFFDGSE